MGVQIPYQEGKFLESELLDLKHVRWVSPKDAPARRSVEELLEEALGSPLGSPKLEEEEFKSLALVFSDNMRLPSPYVPQLLGRLEQKAEDIKLVVAGGTHQVPPEDHVKRVLRERYEDYRGSVVYSSTQNPSSVYEYVGETSRGTRVELNQELLDRDLVLSTLCVRPHYFAGWEGGAKALLPGCSSFSTISRNHSYVVGNPNARELVLEGNPVREDINEVPGILEQKGVRYRVADFVPNQANQPVRIAYGDPLQTHQELTEFGRGIYEVKVKPAPVVIAVAEGPHGQNFYQGLKAITHASNVVKPGEGSKLILVGDFSGGIGNKTFEREFETYMGLKAEEVLEDLKRRAEEGRFNETLQKINRLVMMLSQAELMVVSPGAPEELRAMLEGKGMFFGRGLDEALSTIKRELLEDVVVVPKGASTVPMPA